MTEAELEARTQLWEHAADVDATDEESSEWDLAFLEAMLLACERTGLLGHAELDAFRALAAGRARPARRGDLAAAERHLDALAADLRPLSRDRDDAGFEASQRFEDAVHVLRQVGLLDDDREWAWRSRSLDAATPWLTGDEKRVHLDGEGVMLVRLPARDADEEAQDAETDRRMEVLGREGAVDRVLTCREVARHDGLVVTALVARSESTELHFHHVGTVGRDPLGPTVPPPSLADDAGTVYEPVWDRPIRSSGSDDSRTGAWRYQPAAPPKACRFTASLGDATWQIP